MVVVVKLGGGEEHGAITYDHAFMANFRNLSTFARGVWGVKEEGGAVFGGWSTM